MSTGQLLFSALVVAYFILSSLGTRQIVRSVAMTSRQKGMHLVFIWLVPFFWYFVVDALHRKHRETSDINKNEDMNP